MTQTAQDEAAPSPIAAKRVIRASFLPIASKCPPAFAPGQMQIREESGSVTTLGTIGHKVCRQIVKTGSRPEDIDRIAADHDIDPDSLGRATWHAQRIWNETLRGAFPDAQTEVAMRVPIDQGLDISGHTDVLSIVAVGHAGMVARVADWKFGFRTDVDAEPQMRGYAFLACQAHGVDRAQATVVWLADKTYQSWTWSSGELWEWAQQLAQRLEDTVERYAAGDHCRYCPRFFACPAQAQMAQATISALALDDETDKSLPAETIGRLYPAVCNVERLCKAFRDQARATVAAGGVVPIDDERELALVESRRESLDPIPAWPILAEQLDKTELAGCMTISKTKALAAVAAKADRGQKAHVKDELMLHLKSAHAVKSKVIRSLRVVKST